MAASRSPADQASDAARWWRAYDLAKNDQADELRALAAAGGYHALQELARRLAERNMAGELRDLAVAADPGDRPLILRAARDAYSPGMDVTRVCADLGDEIARHGLIRWLARNGHLDELRQRAASGDEYAP